MEFGILSSFTTFTSRNFKQPLNTEERITLHQDVDTTYKKLEVAHRLHKVLNAQLNEADALLISINASSSVHNDVEDIDVDPLDQVEELCGGCSHLAVRMATLQTFIHMAHRYQVVLVRDLLQQKTSLGLPLHPGFGPSWILPFVSLRKPHLTSTISTFGDPVTQNNKQNNQSNQREIM